MLIYVNPSDSTMAILVVSGKREEVADGQTISAAVADLGLHPDAYLYVVDGTPVPMDTVLSGQKVRLLRVASGG